jgi:hypothetical protein
VTGQHVAEEALAYWSGELGEDRRAVIEAHIASCAECRRELETVRFALSALSAWPREPRLSPELEERLVASARTSTGPAWLKRIAAVLVVALVGGAGFLAGRATVAAPIAPATPAAVDTTLNSYLLLLEEPLQPARPPVGRDGYRAWAQALRNEHRLVSAEKLTDEPGLRVQSDGRVLAPEESERARHVSGWFLVRARTYDEAVALTRRGPHLRHGSVLVRQVD